MKITQTGFHNISQSTEKTITISENCTAILFDNNSSVEEIILLENAQLKYF
ncbi:MAG: hypothetical protein ACPHY8_06725 [Patescibacteria group bacterium]